MTGVVTDPTGAVIPGAVVALSNPSTGVSYTQTTDSLGTYRFLNVPPGAGYKAVFSHDGFSVAEISDISLGVAVTRTQNVRLCWAEPLRPSQFRRAIKRSHSTLQTPPLATTSILTVE